MDTYKRLTTFLEIDLNLSLSLFEEENLQKLRRVFHLISSINRVFFSFFLSFVTLHRNVSSFSRRWIWFLFEEKICLSRDSSSKRLNRNTEDVVIIESSEQRDNWSLEWFLKYIYIYLGVSPPSLSSSFFLQLKKSFQFQFRREIIEPSRAPSSFERNFVRWKPTSNYSQGV